MKTARTKHSRHKRTKHKRTKRTKRSTTRHKRTKRSRHRQRGGASESQAKILNFVPNFIARYA